MIAIARRALNAFALRFSEAEKRLAELSLVQSPPLTPGGQSMITPDGEVISVDISLFNPKWLGEFGIIPNRIFDIGSYDAGEAVWIKQAFPSAAIYAFEADSSRFVEVERNARAFGVVAVNAAVCDCDGEVDWFQSRPVEDGTIGAQGSLFLHTEAYKARYPSIKQATGTKVQSTRLDTFCSRSGSSSIDLLHVDVEGAEFNVISGMGELRPAMIFVETMSRGLWQGARSSADVHRLLSSRGYALVGDFRSDRLYVRPDVIAT